MASPDCSISCGDGYDVTTIDELSAKFSVQGTSSSKTSGKKKVLSDSRLLDLRPICPAVMPSTIYPPHDDSCCDKKLMCASAPSVCIGLCDSVVRGLWVSEALDEIPSVTLVRSWKILLDHKASETWGEIEELCVVESATDNTEIVSLLEKVPECSPVNNR
uniref:Uncharacterized protein n=1 Tax=Timema cristinae TaxID=61476 RepID=A0A7R9GZX8_TIMCR|nr:unnamed protein product [Timema cristinae]